MAQYRKTREERRKEVEVLEEQLKKIQNEQLIIHRRSLKTETDEIRWWELDEEADRIVKQIKHHQERIRLIDLGLVKESAHNRAVHSTERSKAWDSRVDRLKVIKPTLTRHVSFTITPEIHEWLKTEAGEQGISMSQLAFEILNEKFVGANANILEGMDGPKNESMGSERGSANHEEC